MFRKDETHFIFSNNPLEIVSFQDSKNIRETLIQQQPTPGIIITLWHFTCIADQSKTCKFIFL